MGMVLQAAKYNGRYSVGTRAAEMDKGGITIQPRLPVRRGPLKQFPQECTATGTLREMKHPVEKRASMNIRKKMNRNKANPHDHKMIK